MCHDAIQRYHVTPCISPAPISQDEQRSQVEKLQLVEQILFTVAS